MRSTHREIMLTYNDEDGKNIYIYTNDDDNSYYAFRNIVGLCKPHTFIYSP